MYSNIVTGGRALDVEPLASKYQGKFSRVESVSELKKKRLLYLITWL